MNWGEPGPLVFNIVVGYCCKWTMLKRNWNWRNNRLFCHIFVIGKISIREGPRPPASPWLRQCSNWQKQKGVRKFFARFLVFYNKISTVKKIVLSSSRGQGNFRGPKASRPRPSTGGFEAKAKDLKMCPWGFHLWPYHSCCRRLSNLSKSCRLKDYEIKGLKAIQLKLPQRLFLRDS